MKKKIVFIYIDWILTAAGVLLVAALGWFLVWGTTMLAEQLGKSLDNPISGKSGESFNLSEASQLNLRGLNGR